MSAANLVALPNPEQSVFPERQHISIRPKVRNAPALLQVRLKFVFLRMFETVTCDIDSIYPSSTVLSARSRSVHLEYPSGGCPHASAMMCASTSPVTFAGIGGVSRFFLLIVASSPFFYNNKSSQSVLLSVWYGMHSLSPTQSYTCHFACLRQAGCSHAGLSGQDCSPFLRFP